MKSYQKYLFLGGWVVTLFVFSVLNLQLELEVREALDERSTALKLEAQQSMFK